MAAYRAAAILSLALVLCSLQCGVEAATDCTTVLTGLTGCANFLTDTSATPDQKTCCTPLETVLITPSSFQCLCAEASSSSSSSSASLKNALLLPKACKLSTVVSQDNCTQSSNTTSNSTSSSSPNTGFMSASPFSLLLALAITWSLVSLIIFA